MWCPAGDSLFAFSPCVVLAMQVWPCPAVGGWRPRHALTELLTRCLQSSSCCPYDCLYRDDTILRIMQWTNLYQRNCSCRAIASLYCKVMLPLLQPCVPAGNMQQRRAWRQHVETSCWLRKWSKTFIAVTQIGPHVESTIAPTYLCLIVCSYLCPGQCLCLCHLLSDVSFDAW